MQHRLCMYQTTAVGQTAITSSRKGAKGKGADADPSIPAAVQS